jgi:hypothetical protein
MVSCDMSGRTITATRTGCTSGAIVVISTAHFVSFVCRRLDVGVRWVCADPGHGSCRCEPVSTSSCPHCTLTGSLTMLRPSAAGVRDVPTAGAVAHRRQLVGFSTSYCHEQQQLQHNAIASSASNQPAVAAAPASSGAYIHPPCSANGCCWEDIHAANNSMPCAVGNSSSSPSDEGCW